MHTVLKTMVGSRMLGVHNEDSDYDFREVVVSTLPELLSRGDYKMSQSKHGCDDRHVVELRHFCEQLSKGSPSAVQFLYSPTVHDQELLEVVYKFLDSGAASKALRGYASSVLQQVNKETDPKKRGKATYSVLGAHMVFLKVFGGHAPMDFELEVLKEYKQGLRDTSVDFALYYLLGLEDQYNVKPAEDRWEALAEYYVKATKEEKERQGCCLRCS